MKCKAVREMLNMYLDGEIMHEKRRVEIREHLEECPGCSAHAQQLEEVSRLVKSADVAPLKDRCVTAIMEEIARQPAKELLPVSLFRMLHQFCTACLMKPAFYYLVMLILMGRIFLLPSQDGSGEYPALADRSYQKALSQRPLAPAFLDMAYADEGKCIKCDGSGKCQVCSGTGKNNSDDNCSICSGTGKCYYCSGTGKK